MKLPLPVVLRSIALPALLVRASVLTQMMKSLMARWLIGAGPVPTSPAQVNADAGVGASKVPTSSVEASAVPTSSERRSAAQPR
jgi:hypothetical protein